jgi:hypothetical protein
LEKDLVLGFLCDECWELQFGRGNNFGERQKDKEEKNSVV